MVSQDNTCQVYGDNRPYKPGVTVSLMVDGMARTIRVCDEHQAFFEDWVPGDWALGLTFTNEVEIRPFPAVPYTPPANDPTNDRGILFLKTGLVDHPMNTEEFTGENDLLWSVDTELQGDIPLPSWYLETVDGPRFDRGIYQTQVSGKGQIVSDPVPSTLWAGFYSNEMFVSLDWISEGIDTQNGPDIPFFPVGPTSILEFQTVDSTSLTNFGQQKISKGLYGGSYGSLDGDSRITLDIKLSMVKIAAGQPFTEDNFS